jgi:hypothetical protein
MEDMDFISMYIAVKRELNEARKAVLAHAGYTEHTLRQLEDQATAQLGDQTLEIDGCTIYTSETPIFVHKGSTQIGTRRKIHINTR